MDNNDPIKVNRSRTCHCCEKRSKRIHIRVGKPGDGDYAVAICPDCDVIKVKKPAPKEATEESNG